MMSGVVRWRSRSGLAWLTVVSLGLVISAPIWHQGHHPIVPTHADNAEHEPDLHICGTGGHATLEIACPICLLQRLLTQTDAGATPQLAVPSPKACSDVPWAAPIPITVSHLAQPRAPPRV
jgi:hypothetical protein